MDFAVENLGFKTESILGFKRNAKAISLSFIQVDITSQLVDLNDFIRLIRPSMDESMHS